MPHDEDAASTPEAASTPDGSEQNTPEQNAPKGNAPNDSAVTAGRLHGLRREAAAGVAAGAHEASNLGRAAGEVHLQSVATGLEGGRVLFGHVLGTHVELKAGGLHGPRQIPAVVYLFADALAVRPSDDAPMSTVPLLGLHMVFPPAAVTRWLYKAGRIEHANLDLVEVADTFEAALPAWTVDDFAEADPKLEVLRSDSFDGPLHVYEHLGFAHLWAPVPDRPPMHLKSTLPPTPEAFAKLWQLCGTVAWSHGVTMEVPHGADTPGTTSG